MSQDSVKTTRIGFIFHHISSHMQNKFCKLDAEPILYLCLEVSTILKDPNHQKVD